MEILGVVLRLVVVSVVSILLSILAMVTIKGLGVNLKDIRQRTNPRVLLIAALFNLFFIGAVAMLLRFWDHETLQRLGLSLDISGIIFSIAVLIISLSLAVVYVWLLHAGKLLRITWNRGFLSKSQPLNTFFAFIVLFIAAFQEEVLFRGYFSFALIPYGFWYALIISSAAFTAWHFLINKANIFQTIDWLLGGVMLFYIYWLCGTVWITALVHFSRNFSNVIVFNISGSDAIISYEKPIRPSQKTAYTILYSIAIMVFGLLFFM